MIEQSLCFCKLDLLKLEAISKKPITYCNFFKVKVRVFEQDPLFQAKMFEKFQM